MKILSPFPPEQEEHTVRILQSIQTAHEAAGYILEGLLHGNWREFDELTGVLEQLLNQIYLSALPYQERLDKIILPLTCKSALGSLSAIRRAGQRNARKCLEKLQFEFIPILEEAYMSFYYWAFVYTHPEREEVFYKEELSQLGSNPYINEARKTGQYRYDVAFGVLAYNKLEYTKLCVENLLKNIPNGLNYELILWDNGSSDNTVAYFESKHPTKLLESRYNWSVGQIWLRSTESRYFFGISNDVIVLPGAIENMLSCIQSDENIAYVVPTTPNVSNLQGIPAAYGSFDEMYAFARKNNLKDSSRWEQRIRLVNPIALCRTDLHCSDIGICQYCMPHSSYASFPDDELSLLYRRRGKKLMLAKDAYCHHFGSVTLRDEIDQKKQEEFYLQGRKNFYARYSVDPWGTGACYDLVFRTCQVEAPEGHVEILGINCGLGSNALKIKEQLKEYYHSTDCSLWNITDQSASLPDLKGISDFATLSGSVEELHALLSDRTFQYIVWEEPWCIKASFPTVLKAVISFLAPNGKLFLRETKQNYRHLRKRYADVQLPDSLWYAIQIPTL